MFNGAVSFVNGEAAAVSDIYAIAIYSTDGGATWISVSNGAETTIGAGEEQALPAIGILQLAPNTTYEFGAYIVGPPTASGGSGYCDLSVTVSHQMPGMAAVVSAPASK